MTSDDRKDHCIEQLETCPRSKEYSDMDSTKNYERALNPEDISRFFVAHANAGDVDGLVAMYESKAVLACPDGQVAVGSKAIRGFSSELLVERPRFEPGEQQ